MPLGASTVSTHSPKNAVFIELDRITESMLEAFELLVHNALILIEPDRMHTLVAGNRGFTIMQKLNSRISVDLTILCYPAEFSSADEYNNVSKSDFSWRQFSRKHLLMYQGDTIVLRGGAEKFLQYDCAGAPWPCRDPDDNHCVGDGGFIVKSCIKEGSGWNNSKLSDEILMSLNALATDGAIIVKEKAYFEYEVGSGAFGSLSAAVDKALAK